MGRPLRKDVNGLDVIGTPASTNIGITVNFHDGTSNRTDGVIIKQRGASTYMVTRIGDLATRNAGEYLPCKLVDGTPSAKYEMQMTGSTSGQLDADLVNIAKLTKRIATDFSGNKYKWYIESDSSADYIVLTAL